MQESCCWPPYCKLLDALTKVKFLLIEGKYDEARTTLDPLMDKAVEIFAHEELIIHRTWTLITIEKIQAYTLLLAKISELEASR
jgi:hypothetical protein